MQQVGLPNSPLSVSRLGLGLGSVHRINSARGRLELVRAAIDLGITHFDTARLYGDGLAERVLGQYGLDGADGQH